MKPLQMSKLNSAEWGPTGCTYRRPTGCFGWNMSECETAPYDCPDDTRCGGDMDNLKSAFVSESHSASTATVQ